MCKSAQCAQQESPLPTADGVGTNEIMRQTGKSKTCVWRWQGRFMEEGFEGLSIRPPTPSPGRLMKGARYRRWNALSPDCR